MRRDTLVFSLAGVVFGFVAGYMAAGWDVMPRPAVAAPTPAASPDAPAAAQPAALDPDEVRAMESLANRQPGERAPRVELGNLYMDHQRWEEAIRWYREALSLGPDDADVATDLGACLVHAGRPKAGLAEFERVLQRNPGHRNALFNRGVALLNLGRAAEAADVWEALLQGHPDDPQLQRLRERIDEIRATTKKDGVDSAERTP
jgi:cytochrome c-type biogenesis protein CcmH/NrfG